MLQPSNAMELPATTIAPAQLFTFDGLNRLNRAMRSWAAYLDFPDVRGVTIAERISLLAVQIAMPGSCMARGEQR